MRILAWIWQWSKHCIKTSTEIFWVILNNILSNSIYLNSIIKLYLFLSKGVIAIVLLKCVIFRRVFQRLKGTACYFLNNVNLPKLVL